MSLIKWLRAGFIALMIMAMGLALFSLNQTPSPPDTIAIIFSPAPRRASPNRAPDRLPKHPLENHQAVGKTSRAEIEEKAQLTHDAGHPFHSNGQGTATPAVTARSSGNTEGAAASPSNPNRYSEITTAGSPHRTVPQAIYAPRPKYPELARRRGTEGTVKLQLKVNTSGNVETLTISHPSPSPLLDRSARDTVKNWRFAPPNHPIIFELAIEFKLTPQG